MKPTDEIMSEPELNAGRLAACWNGCRGINPDAVPDLLVALEDLLRMMAQNHHLTVERLDRGAEAQDARAALAKARKGA